MRLPYVDTKDLSGFSPDDAAIVERIEARRKPRPLQPLDLTLLHSPAVADGFNTFFGNLRSKTTIGADIREIAMCRVGIINEAWYEWRAHAPIALAAGVSKEGLSIVAEPDLSKVSRGSELSEKQWAVLLYTEEMTKKVKVSDELFAEVKKHFSDKEMVEITAVVRLTLLGIALTLMSPVINEVCLF